METTELTVTVFNGSHRRPTPFDPVGYPHEGRAFAGIELVMNAGDWISRHIQVPGWWVKSNSAMNNIRRAIRVELPQGVHDGPYCISNAECLGLYSDYECQDGMGATVYAYCAESAEAVRTGQFKGAIIFTDEDLLTAIDKAIASGIIFSVPQKDGTRKEVPVKVLQVSKPFGVCQTADMWD